MLRTLLLVAIFAAAAPCSPLQDDPSKQPLPEIRGTVTELGTHIPVPDVEVTIFRLPERGPGIHSPKYDDAVTLHTDSSGGFRMAADKLGDYSVEIEKDGWGARGLLPGSGLNASAQVSLTKEHPSRELKFQMARPAELAGRVVDFESGKPVASLRVQAMLAPYSGRQRIAVASANFATAGDDGRFAIKGLMPGDYVLQVCRTCAKGSGLTQQFTRKDLETVEQGYQESYWPGGGDLQAAAPVAVGSGAHAFVGEIAARKIPIYRIHGTLAAGGCAPGEKVSLGQVTPQSEVEEHRSIGELDCGKEFLIVGKEPGTYWLQAFSTSGGRNLTASVPVTITDKNVEAAIALAPGVAVDVRYVVAEGSRLPDFKPIRLLLRSIRGSAAGFYQSAPDADGRLRLADLPIGDYKVMVSGVPKSFYVKELRYNGSALSGKVVPLNGEALAHNLEIALDDKPAALSGVVGGSGHPAANAQVRVVKCPLTDAAYRDYIGAAADGEGRFRIGGLAPGTYRVFAVEREMIGDLENFYVLDRVLKGAKEVTLDVNGFQDLTLDLADPRR